MRKRVSWEGVVRAAEKVRGERSDEWAEPYGNWGRAAVMYVALSHGGLRLAKVVRELKGPRYQAAAQAVKRFGQSLAEDSERGQFVAQLRCVMSLIQT